MSLKVLLIVLHFFCCTSLRLVVIFGHLTDWQTGKCVLNIGYAIVKLGCTNECIAFHFWGPYCFTSERVDSSIMDGNALETNAGLPKAINTVATWIPLNRQSLIHFEVVREDI